MKLIIPILDDPQKIDNFHIGTMIQDLEQKIANQYFVYPVMSNKAYESFEMDDGSIKNIYHVVFGYVTKGRLSDLAIVYTLFKHVWNDVQKAWNPGDLVIWRRRPEAKEENNKDPGWFEAGKNAPDNNAPDNWLVQVTVRLGSFESPQRNPKIHLLP